MSSPPSIQPALKSSSTTTTTATALSPLPPPAQHNTEASTNSLPSIPSDKPSMAPQSSPASGQRKRKSSQQLTPERAEASNASASSAPPAAAAPESPSEPKAKKSRTNTPWTPAEEQRLKQMRDAGNSWSEIAKTFPQRTEGSVKKHWYKDMHYAEFAEDESAALLAAIKEYEANKWKAIGQKVGKPAKACEQYAKEHFGGKL